MGNFTGESDFLEQKECLAANPKIYGQLVGVTGKYSKFASAGDKAAVRQARGSISAAAPEAAAAPVAGAGADVGKPDESAPF